MLDLAFNTTLKFEGGYANNPNDPGGRTNKGVTQDTYDHFRRAWVKPLQDVKKISDDEVRLVYEAYWKDCKADVIQKTHPKTATFHFDTAFNAGDFQAAKLLQRALRVTDDGHIGPYTLTALSHFTDDEVLSVYYAERIKFYNALVTKRPNLAEFLKGWTLRCNKLCKILSGTEKVI